MKIFDQHVHTELSVDSEEKFENYLMRCDAMGVDYFVSTEHLDLGSGRKVQDIMPNFDQQRALIEKYQSQYKVKILMGIEVGYKSRVKDRNEEVLENNDFDVVLLSVHENEEVGVTSEEFVGGRTPEQIYDNYLVLCIKAATEFDNFDIFTHVDFILRYIDKVDIRKFENRLKELFRVIIEKNKVLEFNTRFLYSYNDSSYIEFIFQTYFDMGGRNISLGSDAHSAGAFHGQFKWAAEILKSIGFKEVTLFIKREAIKAEL